VIGHHKTTVAESALGGVYKTPVFDSAARGFVTVTGGPYLQKRRSAILSLFELGRDNGRIDNKK